MYYLLFVISAALVIFAGVKLSVYADILADKTGLGHSFIGITLLALMTSLPELISSIGAVTVVDSPDLAFGNVYGSNAFNIFIFFIVDMLFRKDSLYKNVSNANFNVGIYAVLITVVSILPFVSVKTEFFHLSIFSPILIIIFMASIYTAYTSDKATESIESNTQNDNNSMSLTTASLMFMLMALIILGSGLMLSKSADKIAEITGLGQTVVGSFMLAFVTSLPELSSSVGALRIGAPNLAVGNLFGSNVFNIAVLPIVDIFYRKENVFLNVSEKFVESALFASILVIIALLGISQDKIYEIKFKSVSLFSITILLCYILYFIRTLG